MRSVSAWLGVISVCGVLLSNSLLSASPLVILAQSGSASGMLLPNPDGPESGQVVAPANGSFGRISGGPNLDFQYAADQFASVKSNGSIALSFNKVNAFTYLLKSHTDAVIDTYVLGNGLGVDTQAASQADLKVTFSVHKGTELKVFASGFYHQGFNGKGSQTTASSLSWKLTDSSGTDVFHFVAPTKPSLNYEPISLDQSYLLGEGSYTLATKASLEGGDKLLASSRADLELTIVTPIPLPAAFWPGTILLLGIACGASRRQINFAKASA